MVLGRPTGSPHPPPLSDAGAAGVSQHGGVDVGKGLHLAVALDGGAYLLGAGGNHKRHRRPDAVGLGLLGNVGGTAHVLVGGVGAAADEGRGNFVHQASVFPQLLGHAGDGPRAVGRVGANQVRLQLGQVDFYHLVVVV